MEKSNCMLLSLLIAIAGLFSTSGATVPGMDVSAYQGNVDWNSAYSGGARFAIIKATEGTGYTNQYFSQQYNGAYEVGMIRGAYHFARPDANSADAEANYFVNHGGRWSKDGKTLPGTLDIEFNPSCGTSCSSSQTCYDLSQSQMASWISIFIETYNTLTGVYPIIYTNTYWYSQCVGTLGDFSSNSPLWISCYGCSSVPLPYNWQYYTFLQFSDKQSPFPGDQDLFNGDYDHLVKLANGP